MPLKIGELAKRAGLTVRALHHYDHIGLLSPSSRSDSGFRLYNQADVSRLHRIQALKQFGWSLSEIRAFLAEPGGATLIEIITQQMNVLDEQVQRALTLRDRLFWLRERIAKGEETGLTDWLTILEMMTMYEKHLSKEELNTLYSNQATGNLDEEWSRLVPIVQDSMDRGISPESREAQELAWRWMRLLRDTTGNDPGLAIKLKQLLLEERKVQLLNGITPEMIEYITHSFANARAAILAKYLSSGELEAVRSRQAAHLLEWPSLVAEVRLQREQGAAPDDPAVQALARRWESLFRASYSGDDLELEDKIRSAFRKESDLLVNIGMDGPLIAFVDKAMMQLKRTESGEENRPDPAPKSTALRVAIYRAAHQLLDAPLVFEDPLALKILGATEERSLRGDLSRHNAPLLKGLRTSVAVRSRLAEDEWARSKQRGVRQYVILGAGLDTFAYRNRDRDDCIIFEADFPATQQWKRDCLRATGIEEPSSLTFVPIDFDRSTLHEALGKALFRQDEPAFFSWLGVTMYLEEESIMSTFRFIASLAPGSGVVFDYAVLPSLLSPREQKALEVLSGRASEGGEPWKTFFDPASLATMLHSLGFSEVEDHGLKQLNERYLSGRTDGLRKSGVARLVCAGV
ncbi:MAG: SAM-dependent methyltransferase [Syntrophobacteraceae bacterium]